MTNFQCVHDLNEVGWHGDSKVTCEVEWPGDKARRREVGMASG